MKIKIKNLGTEVTWESEQDDLDSVVRALRGLLVAAGFHPAGVDEFFEESWDIEIKQGKDGCDGNC